MYVAIQSDNWNGSPTESRNGNIRFLWNESDIECIQYDLSKMMIEQANVQFSIDNDVIKFSKTPIFQMTFYEIIRLIDITIDTTHWNIFIIYLNETIDLDLQINQLFRCWAEHIQWFHWLNFQNHQIELFNNHKHKFMAKSHKFPSMN